MLHFMNGGVLVEHAGELPDLHGQTVYLDLETSSGDESEDSLNPWHHCYVAGIAVTVDSLPTVYYIPVNHQGYSSNVDIDKVQAWLIKLFSSAERWVNHNVKYDCQVLFTAMGVDVRCELIDTVVRAKLLHSDRFTYGLDDLSRDWLCEDISVYTDRLKPYLNKNKDYGQIPADILGEYACQDVYTNRRLFKYIDAHMPDECRKVERIETETTSLLVEVERAGMQIIPQNIDVQTFLTLREQIELAEKCHQFLGFPIQPNKNEDCFDVLCNKYGFPILGYTDSGNPSFDKEALKAYKTLPNAPVELIDWMLRYRRLNVFQSTFLNSYKALHVNGILHSSYNQTVRTGRMSCKMPNGQQLMPEAKALIVCNDDETIISADYAQIEFRLIVHYINDDAAIAAYAKDPETDFHQWVAVEIHIKRKPAKTINFLIGYGGGKAKLLSALMQIAELVGEIQDQAQELVAKGKLSKEESLAWFNREAKKRAESVLQTYHDTFPGLRRVTRQATNTINTRGYVRNLYGRYRRLPREAAHRAFNSLCQGSAADLMKEQSCALFKFIKVMRLPIVIIGLIHDEVLMRAKRSCINDDLLDSISYILEHVSVNLRVPIRTSIGCSNESWLKASECSSKRLFDRSIKPNLIVEYEKREKLSVHECRGI